MESNVKADSLQLLMDLFEFENDSVVAKKPLLSNEPAINTLQLDVAKTGNYKVIILPDFKKKTDFGVKLFTEPTLAFPVSGKDDNAVQSFWGAARGGGSRFHEGIDIFAKRGTPVVASADGIISYTGHRGLGGKQVWLRDGIFGQSLYYAHLDSISVSEGNYVKAGDTLGFVGNTGNAKTTSPHLHFGIYARSRAVDPFPFVKQTKPVSIENHSMFRKGITRLQKNELRIGANVKMEKLLDFKSGTNVEILSKTKSWLHLRVNDSLEGFMHESLVREID